MENKEFRLCKDCKNKDAKAQYELFHSYVKRYIGICERYVEQNDDAKDLVQECFITIFNKIDSFEWQGDHSFEKWMRRIVANIGVNHYQKYKTKRNINIELTDDIAEDSNEELEINGFNEITPDHLNNYQISDDDLLECIKTLPEHFRIVFNMFVIDNYSHKEIAVELGISEKTSTTRLYRARKLLQKDLAGRLKVREHVNGEK
jgi:RNA polymerase sigma-70 factor (ECF subfamily)